uniref:Cystinosin homolog n=1 Tax=Heterorhabditis bacteriophora TaxID=37862 RepID=A0A1I7XU70_HETBA
MSCFLFYTTAEQQIIVDPSDLVIAVQETSKISFKSKEPLLTDIKLYFNKTRYFFTPDYVVLEKSSNNGVLNITGKQPINLAYLEVANCTNNKGNTSSDCDFNVMDVYVRVTVIKSHIIGFLVIIVGWAYFFAWSISFYPQIILNFQRKSVIGLNFDFLLLNVIGFSAYAFYNIFIYFSETVQAEYEKEHPRSPIPVLLNDVVFAIHALFACLITALQCFFYERENQRTSLICMLLSGLLILSGCSAGVLSVLNYINMLEFVTALSYIKMVVTVSKYFPQAYFNFKRKSTVGWSIGNVLLDFSGGSLDILQMVLQCINVENWSALSGNPVKFGLGLISIIFDILFMIQHCVLYRDVDVVHNHYEGYENAESPQSFDNDYVSVSDQAILDEVTH